MSSTRYAFSRRVLLAVLFSIIPFTGCAALSSLQQAEQNGGGTWVRGLEIGTPTEEAEQSRTGQSESATHSPHIRTVSVGPDERTAGSSLAASTALAAIVREESADWIGTRYRYGGTTRRGIDCSSFVQHIMRDGLDVDLPRTTASQVQIGESVSRDDLRPADLVFFRRRGVRHVGIYLGNGEFVHASSRNGVIISSLSEGYYERHFWAARRVVENPRDVMPDRSFFKRPSNPEELLRPGRGRASTPAVDTSPSTHGAGRGVW